MARYRTKLTLTDAVIEKLPRRGMQQSDYWDADTPCFGIRIGKKTKSFYYLSGPERTRTHLGVWPAISLDKARAEARRLRIDDQITNQKKRHLKAIRKQRRANKFNAAEGCYWVAPLPDGKFGVFWSHPTHDGWHHLMASFPNRERAEDYAIYETQGLSPDFARPDLTELPPDEMPHRAAAAE